MKKHLSSVRNGKKTGKIVSGLFFAAVFTMVSLMPFKLFAQMAKTELADSTKLPATTYQKEVVQTTYPKTVGYLSFILPLYTFDKSGTTGNFNSTTTIGFPVGINILYSERFGFSYEITPNIHFSNSMSKLNDVLFDPGTMFRFDHGFTIISRLAFDTNGRYGVTPVFNQVYARTKDVNYFVALSLPARFGNGEESSIGLNLQLGFTFN